MSEERQWLELGLEELAAPQAQRVRLFRSLLGTAALLRARLDRELAPSGVTTQQGALLQFIQSQAEAPTITQVARAMNMTHQNVKQIALALERKGFLDIVTDANDSRARRLQLTRRHHRFWNQHNPAHFAKVEEWTAPLSDAEVRTLVRMLARIRAHLKANAAVPAAKPRPRRATS